MANFVIFNKNTTRIVKERTYSTQYYATEAAAKAAVTRFVKKGICKRDEVEIAEARHFFDFIEKSEIVTNLMSGQQVRQSVNTPHCCDVSSETYWSL